MTIPGQNGGSLCTGEVISPHVVLTAAHCAGGEDPSVTNATWQVYLGNDISKATAAQMQAVTAAHYNASFNVDNLPAGNDVGVLVMKNALPTTITPLPYNRAPMDVGFDGQSVRLVGYGLDDGTAQTGAGIKRTVTTTLSDHSALLLHFGDGAHETCNGDSGGPALMTLAGKETIVGVTSYGDAVCQSGGFDTRIDAMAAWIDNWVNQADPGFLNGSTPPSPSGGAQSPPTSSAPPMPPSSAGAGGVGASCGSGTNCNEVQGGCSLAASGRGNDGAMASLLLLGFVISIKLGRRRARRF
jgi:V8-like Glu-specific endopeptidase